MCSGSERSLAVETSIRRSLCALAYRANAQGAYVERVVNANDLSSAASGDPLLEPTLGAAWRTSIEAEPMDGGTSYRATIFEDGVCVCSVMLAGHFKNDADATRALHQSLSRWIAAYESRGGENVTLRDRWSQEGLQDASDAITTAQ